MEFKCLQDVKDSLGTIASDTSKCTNATVIQQSFLLTNRKGKKRVVAYTQLANFLILNFSNTCDNNISVPRLITKIQNLLGQFNNLTKLVQRNTHLIVSFLNEEFELPLYVDEYQLQSVPAPSLTPPHCSPDKTVTTPVKTRNDCYKCSSSKKVNLSLNKSLQAEKSSHNRLKLFAADIKRNLNIKVLKQRLLRQERKISDMKRSSKSSLKKLRILGNKLVSLKKDRENLMKTVIQLKSENCNLNTKVAILKDEVKGLKSDLRCYQLQFTEILQKDADVNSEKDHLISKKGKTYNTNIRRLVYNELVCDVPVKNCGHLLSTFTQIICGKKMKNVPCPATCAQMAYELGVLTTIQVMQFFLSQKKNICLSWDATTIDGCHVNEVHLTVDRTDCLVLDVRNLPGGKTCDYVTHIVSALTEATDVYSRFVGTPPEVIFSALKASITSTLTDRAAVNACVTRQLCDELDSHLMQLNCNIHPLDSIARHSKQSLRKVDAKYDIKGDCYGSEGTAANLINAVSVLRFKDGTGDPIGFKSMLRCHNLPVGTFVRYVGNRIHVLFHLAGILVLHWRKVNDFIQMQCTAGGLLRSRLLKDMAEDRIMAQVWALGVMGKVFSGPWMSKFYSAQMSNLDMRPLVQSMERQLQEWILMPQSLLQPTINVFGEALFPGEDDALAGLQSFISGEVAVQVDALTAILQSSLAVIQRQMSGFLTEDDLPLHTKCKVSSAPTHNMASERTLGCLDKMFRRAPVATGGFLNGKVRSKMNKCTQWLDAQTPDKQEKLINFAVSEAREERVKRCILDKEQREEISRRRKELADERSRKDKNKVIKTLKKALKVKLFSDLDCCQSIKEKFIKYVEQPDSIIGITFLHTVDQTEFYGRVQSAGTDSIVVGYWGLEESEAGSVDYTICSLSFFADAILGAVVFL